jgi:hypothetical protein
MTKQQKIEAITTLIEAGRAADAKIETDHHKISLVNNGGKKPLHLNPSMRPEDFPEDFHKRRIDLDKEALRAALEEGREIEGASLGERGKHLRIV